MSSVTHQTGVNHAAYAGFLHYLSSGQDPDGLVSADLVGEMTFPHVTFRREGKAAFDALRDGVSDQPWDLEPREVIATQDGFVAVVRITSHLRDGDTMTAHTVSIVTLRDGRLVRLQHWCSGAL